MSCWAKRNISRLALTSNVRANGEILHYVQNDIDNDIIDTQHVMLSEAKHLSVSADWEILHYVQNDIDNDIIDTQHVMLSEAKHLSVGANVERPC